MKPPTETDCIEAPKRRESGFDSVSRGFKWKLIDIVGRQALSMVVFIVLARLLNPESFGLIGLVAVYLSLVGMVGEQGMTAALIQRRELTDDHLHAAFWFNLAWSAALCLATVFFAPVLAALLGDARLTPLLRWSSLALLVNGFVAVNAALFVRDLNFRIPTLRTLAGTATGGVVGVSMALSGWGVWSLVGQQLTMSAAGGACLWFASTYRPAWRFCRHAFRDLLAVASSVCATSLLWFLSCRVDQLIIGRVLGLQPLGLYVVAARLTEMANLLTHQPIAAVALPALSRLQGDAVALRKAIYEGMRYNAVVVFAVFPGLASIAQEAVPFAFGAQWEPAGTVCALLCVNAMFAALHVFFHPTLLATGGIGKYVILSVASTAGIVIACLIGVRFGVTGVVLGLIANSLIMSIPAYAFLKARLGLSPVRYLWPCVAPAVAALAMVTATWLVGRQTAAILPLGSILALKIGTGAATYLGVLALLDRAVLTLVVQSGFRMVFPSARAG